MSGENFTINSDHTLVAFKKHVDDLYLEHKYITYAAPRIGADRSLTQSALFHVWCREYAAAKRKISTKDVNEGLLNGVKRIVKQEFTSYHPFCHNFMVYELENIRDESKRKDYTSSTSWKRGEMYMVLHWFQMMAAEEGIILESKGEFAKNQREHNFGE